MDLPKYFNKLNNLLFVLVELNFPQVLAFQNRYEELANVSIYLFDCIMSKHCITQSLVEENYSPSGPHGLFYLTLTHTQPAGLLTCTSPEDSRSVDWPARSSSYTR